MKASTIKNISFALVAGVLLSACQESDSSDHTDNQTSVSSESADTSIVTHSATAFVPPIGFREKSQQTLLESELLERTAERSNQLALPSGLYAGGLTPAVNAVLFLEDADGSPELVPTQTLRNTADTAEADLRFEDTGTTPGVDIVPVEISTDGTYRLCFDEHEENMHHINVSLHDQEGKRLELIHSEHGCEPVTLAAGNYELMIQNLPDGLDEAETLFCLSMDYGAIHVRQNDCSHMDLRGVTFSNRRLRGTDLRGANLVGAQFDNTSLEFVKLDGAHVSLEPAASETNRSPARGKIGAWFHQVVQDAGGAIQQAQHITHEVQLTADQALEAVHNITTANAETLAIGLQKIEPSIELLNQLPGGEQLHQLVLSKAVFAQPAMLALSGQVDVMAESDVSTLNRYADRIHAEQIYIGKDAKKHWFMADDEQFYHTYLTSGHGELDVHWGAFGRASGGELLAGTQTECAAGENCLDLKTIAFMMTEAPCKWPVEGYYGVVGVCWNLANRGLYFTGKTTSQVPHYAVVESLFGTYGGEGIVAAASAGAAGEKYSWDACLDKVLNDPALRWSGADFLSANAASRMASSKSHVDPRITLYHQYQSRSAADELGRASGELSLAYLQDLLRLNIQENIGAIDPETLNQLLEAHRQALLNIRQIPPPEASSYEAYLAALQPVVQQMINEFQRVLGEHQYAQLMNLH